MVPVWQGDTLHQVRAAQHRVRDRDDPAAARLRRQRPARRDARRRRAAPGGALRRRAGSPRGARDRRRPRPRGRGRTASRRRRDRRRRRPAPVRARASTASRCSRGTRSSPRAAAARCRASCWRPLAGGGGERRFACDLVLISGGQAPAASLPLQAGARAVHDEATGGLELSGLPDGVLRRGELAGASTGPRRSSAPARSRDCAPRAPRRPAAPTRPASLRPTSRARSSRRRRRSAGAGTRQVLRLLLRGRDRQGHRLLRRGGLRLASSCSSATRP